MVVSEINIVLVFRGLLERIASWIGKKRAIILGFGGDFGLFKLGRLGNTGGQSLFVNEYFLLGTIARSEI